MSKKRIGLGFIIFSIIILGIPGYFSFNKYKKFQKLQELESNQLLASFKTRNTEFVNDKNYENNIKSFAEKNIMNIEFDENAPEEKLSTSTQAIVTSSAAVQISEPSQASESAIEKEETIGQIGQLIEKETSTTEKKIVKVVKIEAKNPEPKIETKAETKTPLKKVIIAGTPPKDKKIDALSYYIQLGVFSSRENAEKLKNKVGGSFIVTKSTVNENQFTVRSNPSGKDEIEALRKNVMNQDLGIIPIVRVW